MRWQAAAALAAAAFAAGDFAAAAIAASGTSPILDPEAAMAAIPAALRAGRVFSAEAVPLCAGTACACGALLAWARSLGTKGARRDGEEHGSSRWATRKDIAPFGDPKDPDNNIILTDNARIRLVSRRFDLSTDTNDNVLVVGGPGTGKTRYYVKPNLLQANASFFVTDPKGTLIREMGSALAELGYCDADIPSASGVERLNVLIFGLKNSTLIPYVLYVRKNAESSSEESKIYALLESYIVRRMLVQATTKNYNRLFTSLILNEVKDAEALRKALEANDEATTYMPGDAEVRAAFEESCLYNLQSKGVLYLLESAIRPGMSSTALLGFNQYTLEHMMPKKWRNKWGALDDEAAKRRDRKLLTLGNLAIITHSLNASIRDADWPTKKQGKGYKDGLALCAAGLATMAGALEKESWNEGDIADRAEWLADKALEVWR